MTWEQVMLGDICRPKQWKTLSKKEMSSEGFPVYGANGRIGFSETYTHEKPVILVGCRGSCGTVHVTEPRSYANGNAMALDALDERRVDRCFLEKYLRYRGFRDTISGTSQPQIIRANLVKVDVLLPPLNKQKRIAGVLDAADALRAKRREALAQLDTLLQSTFLDMFGDPVTNPMGWELKNAADLAQRLTVGIVVKPASYYVEQGVPALRSLNVRAHRIELDNLVYFSRADNETKLTKTRVWKNDILLVRSGQPGTAAIVPDDLNGVNAIDLLILTPLEGVVHPVYLCHYFNSPGGRKFVLGGQRGQIQKHLNVGVLKKSPIPLPPLDLQRHFATIVESVERQKGRMRAQLTELDNVFASLQSRAFNGDL